MKTKHILTALALPAMFAACTADDIEGLNNGLQQAERAKLSKDFVLNIENNGVESRYAVGADGSGLKFVFEEGDLIGANLIDQYNPSPSVDVADWTILPYVAPSLPFKNIGGEEWKSDAELGVGNYLFTYPFNSKDNSRAAAAFELPRIQHYDSKNPNAFIEDYNKAVGAVTLYAGQTDANVALKNLYTYPKFVINFDNGEEVTKVTKVVLKKTGEFAYKGGFDHKAIVEAFQTAADIKENEDLTEDEKKEAIAAHWAALQTSDFIIDGETNDRNYNGFVLSEYGMAETTEYLIVEMDEAVKTNATTNNKSFEVRLMMPSVANMFGQGLSMHIVTDNGTYQVNFGNSYKDTECDFVFKTDNETKIEAALTRSEANTLRTKNLTLSADKSNDGNLGNIVTTAEDWNNLVKNTKGATKDVKVSILSDDFALTSDLDMPKDKVYFSINTKVAVEGEVTLRNIKATEIVVKEGAVLTTSPTLTTTGVVTVEEGAELVFAAAYDKDDNLINYRGIDKIVNYGIVTVPAGVKAKVNFKDADTNTKMGNEKSGVLNVGSATASRAAADAVAYLEGINKGTINNYSIVEVPENYWFTNYSSAMADYKYSEKTQKYDGVPTVNNKETFKSVGTTTNYGLVITEGTLSSNYKTTSEFANAGELQIAKACPTFIDTNAEGVIVLADYNESKLTINDAKEDADYDAEEDEDGYRGTIRYTAAEKENKIDLTASMVNELVVEGNLELTGTFTYTAEGEEDETVCELPELIINADSKIAVAAYTLDADNNKVYTAHVTKMTVKKEVVATVDGDINAVDEIVLEEKAELNIPVGATLAVAKIANVTFGTGSKLIVDGTLNNAELTGDKTTGVVKTWTTKPDNVEISKQGVVIGTKDTSVSETEKEAAKNAAIKNALQPLVEAWIKNTSDINVTNVNSWAGINATGISSSFKSEYLTITWVKAAANAFVTAYNAIDGVTDIELSGVKNAIEANSEIIGAYNKDYATSKPSVLKTVYTAAYTKDKIAAAVKAALGNSWILTSENVPAIYVKEYAAQKVEEIDGLMEAYKVEVDELIENKGTLGNAEWLSLIAWSEAEDATTKKGLYPNNIYDYAFVDAASYIEAYEGSNLYNDMKLWKDLSDKYSNAGYKNLAANNFVAGSLTVERMTAFFEAVYKYANNDEVSVLFKNDADVKKVTAEKVVETSALKYYPAQLEGMANNSAALNVTAAGVETK